MPLAEMAWHIMPSSPFIISPMLHTLLFALTLGTDVDANKSVCNIGDMMKGDDGTMCHAISAKGTRLFYCWSHGLGRNPKHTSESCNSPLEGHKKEATLDNMMGGCNNIASRRRRSQTNTKSKKE